jgi:hypothetical protein
MKGPAPAVAQTVHHERDRALLRRGAPSYSMVCLVNVKSVDRIIYSIFQRFNLEWKTRTSPYSHKLLDVTEGAILLARTIPL